MTLDTDILIVGAGIVGLTASLAAARSGLSVTLIDAAAPHSKTLPEFDGRASAIAASSFNMLRALGVAERLEGQTAPINDILISDGQAGAAPSPLSLHFDAADIAPDGKAAPMGYMCENRHLRAALLAQISQLDTISWHAPAKVINSGTDEACAWALCEDGQRLTARLILAADGRNSPLRRRAKIEVTGWDYDQWGIVTTVSHDLPHNNIAHELFLPSGPFAILPLPDQNGPESNKVHRSSIVWTEASRAAKAAMELPDDLFAAELARRFGGFLGQVKPCAPRQAYPLGLQMAKNYTAARLMLLGDAAHAIHPIAGQGLNMGLRDVAALADVLQEAVDMGADIGANDALASYEQWRSFDNNVLAASTDIFNRLFSNNIGPIKHARRLGLGLVDKAAPARKFFMREAAGQTGTLASLLRG